MIRNSHRVGDYLMVDDESGLVHYHSEMIERWDGLWVRKDQYETRHPQEFVMALNDPRALHNIRPDDDTAGCASGSPLYIGTTSVKSTLSGPGSRLFDYGIGDMCIGGSFVVRPDP